MAKKKKHTTALFDVISKSKRYHTPVLRKAGPSWWPFGRRRLVSATASPETQPAKVGKTPVEPAKPMQLAVVEYAEPVKQQAAVVTETYVAPPHQPYIADPEEHEELPGVADPLRRSLEYAVDPDRKVIAFRMNYTVAIVGAFAVLVIVGLAVIVGQHLRGEPTPLMTPSVASLQAGPANRDVLKVPPRTVAATSHAKPTGEMASQQLTPARGTPSFNEPRPPVDFATADGKRYVGLNYVIIQSYRPTEEKMAREACQFLNENKVPCTMERDLKGWDKLIVVVGMKGFDHISAPAFKTYESEIQRLSLQYAGSAKSYKAFQPSPKKWDRQ